MNANLLRAQMVKLGRTQAEVAKAIGISENSMSRSCLESVNFGCRKFKSYVFTLTYSIRKKFLYPICPKNATILILERSERMAIKLTVHKTPDTSEGLSGHIRISPEAEIIIRQLIRGNRAIRSQNCFSNCSTSRGADRDS